MKISTKKIEVERFEVIFTTDDLLMQLRFIHNDEEMKLPTGTVLSVETNSQGIPMVVACFEKPSPPVEKPSPPVEKHPETANLTQSQVDIWSTIRAAGDDGITYKRLSAIVYQVGGLSPSSVRRNVAALAQAGLVHQCGTQPGHNGHQQKVWRSSE